MRPDQRPAREIADDQIVRLQLRCLTAGIPFDVVDVLGFNELMAYCVILGEQEGGKFDWDRGEWEQPPEPAM